MTVTKASLGIGDLHFSNSPARRHTKKQLRKAINQLLELGYLRVCKNYKVGQHGRIFQLTKPKNDL